MKKLFLLASLLTFNAFATEFQCQAPNGSQLIMGKKELTVKAINLPNNDELKAHLLKVSGLNFPDSKAIITSLKFVLPLKKIDCRASSEKLLNCHAAKVSAQVELSYMVQSMAGFSNSSSSGTQTLTNVTIQTALASNGPIVLGSGPTTVTLDNLNTATEGSIELDGEIIKFELDTNFKHDQCK